MKETTYFFKVGGLTPEREFPLERSRLRQLVASIKVKDLNDETALYTDTSSLRSPLTKKARSQPVAYATM